MTYVIVSDNEIIPRGVLAGTSIDSFNVTPTRPAVGDTVTISGYLRWHYAFWHGNIVGAEVEILRDGVVIATPTTDSEGNFVTIWKPDTVGEYTIQAHYPGTLVQYKESWSPPVTVTVITPEQKAEEERNFWTMVGIGAVVALVGIGAAVYLYQRERRMEMLMVARR